MTIEELEQKVENLRVLAGNQEVSISSRQANDEAVATSEIAGLAQLYVRIDTLERIATHRRTLQS